MSIKEQVVRESIARIEARIATIDEVVFANPLSQIIKGRMKANEILSEHKDDHQTILELIKPLAAEEKRLFALAEKQKQSSELIDEKATLSVELVDLKNELFHITSH